MRRAAFQIDGEPASADAVATCCHAARLAVGRQTRLLNRTAGEKRSGKHRARSATEKTRSADERTARRIARNNEVDTMREAAKIRVARRRARREEEEASRSRRVVSVKIETHNRPHVTAAGGRNLARDRAVVLYPALFDRSERKQGSAALVFRIKTRSLDGRGAPWRRGEAARFGRYLVRESALEGESGEAVLTNIVDPRVAPGNDLFVQQVYGFLTAYEQFERAADPKGQIYKSLIIALPHELDFAGRRRIADRIGNALARRNIPYLAALHSPDPQGDQRNFHLHVMVMPREFERSGDWEWSFAATKARELFHPAMIRVWRRFLVASFNRELALAGRERRYTLRPAANVSAHAGRYKTEQARQASRAHLVADIERRQRDADAAKILGGYARTLVDLANSIAPALANTVAIANLWTRARADRRTSLEDVRATLVDSGRAVERIKHNVDLKRRAIVARQRRAFLQTIQHGMEATATEIEKRRVRLRSALLNRQHSLRQLSAAAKVLEGYGHDLWRKVKGIERLQERRAALGGRLEQAQRTRKDLAQRMARLRQAVAERITMRPVVPPAPMSSARSAPGLVSNRAPIQVATDDIDIGAKIFAAEIARRKRLTDAQSADIEEWAKDAHFHLGIRGALVRGVTGAVREGRSVLGTAIKQGAGQMRRISQDAVQYMEEYRLNRSGEAAARSEFEDLGRARLPAVHPELADRGDLSKFDALVADLPVMARDALERELAFLRIALREKRVARRRNAAGTMLCGHDDAACALLRQFTSKPIGREFIQSLDLPEVTGSGWAAVGPMSVQDAHGSDDIEQVLAIQRAAYRRRSGDARRELLHAIIKEQPGSTGLSPWIITTLTSAFDDPEPHMSIQFERMDDNRISLHVAADSPALIEALTALTVDARGEQLLAALLNAHLADDYEPSPLWLAATLPTKLKWQPAAEQSNERAADGYEQTAVPRSSAPEASRHAMPALPLDQRADRQQPSPAPEGVTDEDLERLRLWQLRERGGER